MKKNTLTLTLVLVAGITLFSVATVAASSSNLGYEKFKDLMTTIEHTDQGEISASIKVTDNDATLLEADVRAIGGKESEEASGSVNMITADTNKSLDFYKTEDVLYVIDQNEEGYYAISGTEEDGNTSHGPRGRGDKDDSKDHSMTAIEEEIMDYIVGDLKDNFIVTENADKTVIDFAMENTEVPELVNLMVKAGSAADHRGMNDNKETWANDLPFMDGIDHDQMPDLVEGVKIEEVRIHMTLNSEDEVEAGDFTFVYSGKDAEGEFHEIVVEVSATIDSTFSIPEAMAIDAYDWNVIEHDAH